MTIKSISKSVQNSADELDTLNMAIRNWDAVKPESRYQIIFNLKVIASDILQASIALEKNLGP